MIDRWLIIPHYIDLHTYQRNANFLRQFTREHQEMVLLIRVILSGFAFLTKYTKKGASKNDVQGLKARASEPDKCLDKGEKEKPKILIFTATHYRHSHTETIFGFPFALQILFMLQKKLTMIILE